MVWFLIFDLPYNTYMQVENFGHFHKFNLIEEFFLEK